MTILKKTSVMIVLSLVTKTVAFADAKMHKIAFHVDESDPNVMNMALNNVQNVSNYYAGKGEKAGKDVALIDGVGMAPSGVVRLVELHEQGYAYVRP